MSTSSVKRHPDLPIAIVLEHRSPWPQIGRYIAFRRERAPRSLQEEVKPQVIPFLELAHEAGSPLQSQDDCGNPLCMAVSISTKEKCSKCGKKFQEGPKGFVCYRCKTSPKRYFLRLYVHGVGKVRIYSGPDGYPLDSWERAQRLLTTIRFEIDQGNFDIKRYLSCHLKPLRFENYVQAWAGRREQDCQKQEISQAYLKVSRATSGTTSCPFSDIWISGTFARNI